GRWNCRRAGSSRARTRVPGSRNCATRSWPRSSLDIGRASPALSPIARPWFGTRGDHDRCTNYQFRTASYVRTLPYVGTVQGGVYLYVRPFLYKGRTYVHPSRAPNRVPYVRSLWFVRPPAKIRARGACPKMSVHAGLRPLRAAALVPSLFAIPPRAKFYQFGE